MSVLERKSEYEDNAESLFSGTEEVFEDIAADEEPKIVLTIPEENPEPSVSEKANVAGAQTTRFSPIADGVESSLREVRLPDWVDSLLFDKLRARYDPDWKRFSENLDLSDDDQKRYLGTYFPRSYAEQYCIIKNMMLNKRVRAPYD